MDEDDSKFEEMLDDVNLLTIAGETLPFHLPTSDGFEGRLVAKALPFVEKADLIIGSYLQTYGTSSALASRLASRPNLLLHAGSDIARLGRNSELAITYRTLFEKSFAIATTPESTPLLAKYVPKNQIIELRPGYQLPSYWNSKKVKKEETFQYLANRATDHLRKWRIPHTLLDWQIRKANQAIDWDRLTIGMYGKIDPSKGSFQILSALDRLTKNHGVNLIYVCGGDRHTLTRLFEQAMTVESRSVDIRIWPFVPPWKVPSFVDLVDVVAFLENRFDVAIHGPKVPLEVLWRGKALFLSNEIQEKQPNQNLFRNWENFIAAGDPADEESLAERIMDLCERQEQLQKIGSHGRMLARTLLPSRGGSDNIVNTIAHNEDRILGLG